MSLQPSSPSSSSSSSSPSSYQSFKKRKSIVLNTIKEETKNDVIWLLKIHRYICTEGMITDICSFKTEKDAKFFLSNYISDDIEFLWQHPANDDETINDYMDVLSPKVRQMLQERCIDGSTGKIHKQIRGDLDSMTSIIEEIYESCVNDEHNIYCTHYLLTKSSISPDVVGRALLRYTTPEPAKIYCFDDVIMAVGEVVREIDIYSSQLNRVDQEISNIDIKKAMEQHIQNLENMLKYQKYLIKINEREEFHSIDIESVLRSAETFWKRINCAIC